MLSSPLGQMTHDEDEKQVTRTGEWSSQELTYGNRADVALHGTFNLGDGYLKRAIVRTDTAGRSACLRGNGRCDALTSDKSRHESGEDDRKGLHGCDVGVGKRLLGLIRVRMALFSAEWRS